MAELEELRFCAKYPFTDEAKKKLDSLKLDFEKLDDSVLEGAVKRIENMIFSDAAKIRNSLNEINKSKESFLTNYLITYPVANILVNLNNDFYLKRKYALAQSKNIYYFLQFEQDGVVAKVGKQFFEMKQDTGNEDYLIRFDQYLNSIPSGKNYRLVNLEISNGFVRLDKEALAKAISQKVYQTILSSKVEKKSMPKMFIYFASQISKYKEKHFEEVDLGPIDAGVFPPCVKHVIMGLKSGEKVGHQPRFVLATFLANINIPLEKSIDYFREQPNFNEKKTRYYLEHALGATGGTKYSAPSCAKIESYGLCYKDHTCRWVHPLSYYKKRKEFKINKKKREAKK